MIDCSVLVLNQSYEPLNLCRTRRAVVLIFRGKAEVLENGRGELHSVSCAFQIPSVIRLVYMVNRPRHQRKLSRFEIFSRDQYTCQYCGKQTKDLTLDHVMPRRRGGKHTWDNVVGACIPCNRRKGGRSPDEARMSLLRQPRSPRHDGFYVPYHLLNNHSEWHKYLPSLN
ncbi:MAG: HNH endonuclease [Dehalococcoidia bacterium]|jgi:5-methylcytosine-specific restriction endonuclease McrA